MPIEGAAKTCSNCGAVIAASEQQAQKAQKAQTKQQVRQQHPAQQRGPQHQGRQDAAPQRPSSGGGVARTLTLLVITAGGAAVYWLSSRPAETEVSTLSAEHSEPAETPVADPGVADAPSPTAEAPPRAEAPAEAVNPKHQEQDEPERAPVVATLQFAGSVVAAKGRQLPKGTKCQTSVHISGDSITDLDVSCAGVTLYDTRTRLNGMASIGGSLFELPAKQEGQWVYSVIWSDTGMRSGRSQINFNSRAGQASVWSDSGEAFRVELRVAKESIPRSGDSVFDTPTQVNLLQRRVEPKPAAEGASAQAAPKLGGKCSVTSVFDASTSSGAQCKTTLQCGGKVLYGEGSTGFGPCTLDGKDIVRFDDAQETHEDGDPSFMLDVSGGHAALRDSPSQQSYELEFSLGE